MSILIGIVLITLFYLLVYRTLIGAIPSDKSKPVSDEEDRPYRYRYNYNRDTGRYSIEPSRKPKESLYTPFTDFPKDIHTEDEQISRMRRATDKWIYLFPSTFTGQSAKIMGTSCEIYETSFSACSCMDFYKRKLPCKHMYRLAFFSKRMNAFDWIGDYYDDDYIAERFSLSNRPIAKIIYSLSPDDVLIFHHIVYKITEDEPDIYVDESKVNRLLELGFIKKTGKKNKTRILLFDLTVVEIKRFTRSNGYIFKDMSRNGLLSAIVNSDFDYKNAKGYIVYIAVTLGNGINKEDVKEYLPKQWDCLSDREEDYPFIPAKSEWRRDILEEVIHGD